MFNKCKRIFKSFDRVTIEIRKMNFKKIIIFGMMFLFLGIVFWIAGGRINNIVYLYIHPSGALSIPAMYILWGISFFMCGAIFSGILFGCGKYNRHITYKCLLFIFLMQICVYLVYPLFFKATALFITFFVLVIAEIFCLFAILSCYRIYTLWTVFLVIQFVWLIYNSYISLGFAIIN